METLQQALENTDSDNVDEMKKITAIITGLMAKEKAKVDRILYQEKKQVQELKDRLRSQENNPDDDETINLFLSDEHLWRNFDLQRIGVIDEIAGFRNGLIVALTEEENISLRNIVNAVLSLCSKEYENQKEKLLEALSGKPVKELSLNELNELDDKTRSFQLKLESDIVPFLLENLYKSLSSEEFKTQILPVVITKAKSGWILNINKSMEKKLKGSQCEKYLEACIQICWKLVNHQIPPKFVWDIRGNEESFQCRTTSCIKQKSCVLRVYRPAVYRGYVTISRGKYTCMSCTPGIICNNERDSTSFKTAQVHVRNSTSNNTAQVHVRNSTSNNTAQVHVRNSTSNNTAQVHVRKA